MNVPPRAHLAGRRCGPRPRAGAGGDRVLRRPGGMGRVRGPRRQDGVAVAPRPRLGHSTVVLPADTPAPGSTGSAVARWEEIEPSQRDSTMPTPDGVDVAGDPDEPFLARGRGRRPGRAAKDQLWLAEHTGRRPPGRFSSMTARHAAPSIVGEPAAARRGSLQGSRRYGPLLQTPPPARQQLRGAPPPADPSPTRTVAATAGARRGGRPQDAGIASLTRESVGGYHPPGPGAPGITRPALRRPVGVPSVGGHAWRRQTLCDACTHAASGCCQLACSPRPRGAARPRATTGATTVPYNGAFIRQNMVSYLGCSYLGQRASVPTPSGRCRVQLSCLSGTLGST